MSYAVRDDGRGFRSVNSPDELLRGEYFSAVPVAVSDPSPTRDEVERMRLRAYADPLTGSDRYFAEAQRESLLGNAEAAEAAKALGLARFAEIQADNPWPAE